MFHRFFSSLARSRYLSLFSFSFVFTLGQPEWQSSLFGWFSFLLLFFITWSGRLAEIRWSVWISKSQRSSCISFSWTVSCLCIYHLFVWTYLNFLHNSQWITFPTQSCLVLYSLCSNLLHPLIIWLIVSFQSPQNLHQLFYCVLSIFALTWRCFVLISEEIKFLS